MTVSLPEFDLSRDKCWERETCERILQQPSSICTFGLVKDCMPLPDFSYYHVKLGPRWAFVLRRRLIRDWRARSVQFLLEGDVNNRRTVDKVGLLFSSDHKTWKNFIAQSICSTFLTHTLEVSPQNTGGEIIKFCEREQRSCLQVEKCLSGSIHLKKETVSQLFL